MHILYSWIILSVTNHWRITLLWTPESKFYEYLPKMAITKKNRKEETNYPNDCATRFSFIGNKTHAHSPVHKYLCHNVNCELIPEPSVTDS